VYIPTFNEEKDISIMHSLMQAQPLATWIVISNGEIQVNHVPFVLDNSRGEFGTLMCHVARANPIWRECSSKSDSVIVFQGDDAYITPSWYPGKQEHGKVVPTWNYAVVHARGIPEVIDDKEWLMAHINQLTDIHERQQTQPWKVSDAPDEFIEKLTGAIVGIEIPIRKLEGKWKLGQNRPEPDQQGIIDGLMTQEHPSSHGLAQHLHRYIQANK